MCAGYEQILALLSHVMLQFLRTVTVLKYSLKFQIFLSEKLLPKLIMRKLSDEEMETYRAPFKNEGEDRRPTLTFPREIPVEGHSKVSGNIKLSGPETLKRGHALNKPSLLC